MSKAPSKSAVANSAQGSKANIPEPSKPRPKPPQDEIVDEFDFSYIPDELKDLICGPEAIGGGEFGDNSNSGGGQAGPGGLAGATAANAKEQWKQKQMRRRRREDGEDDEEEDEGSEEDEDGEDEDYWDLSDSEEEEEEEESSEYSEPSEDFPLPGKDSDDEESDDEDRKERRFVLGTHSFLELRDPGLEDALLPKEELPVTETKTGKRLIQQQYADICKELGVLPLRKFLNQMRTDTVDLNRYYLTPSDIIAICKMMENNTKVKYLNLSGNPAGLEGGLAIAKMIENNYTITHLAIAATEIKPAFKKICAAVELNIALESIDLSKNELTDTDMQFVRNFLKETSTLKELYLSRNHIQDQGANNIGTGLLENQSLEILDLGINEMYGEKKATALFGGIAEHPTMKSLNLLNNTLRDAAGNGIRRVFNKNKQMEFLDTRYNILGNPGAKAIGGGMRKGLAMQEYLAGPNDWRQDAAASILLPFTNEKTSPEMKTIDFGWLFDVYSQFLKAEARVLKARPDLKIIRGNPFGQWKAKGPDAKALVIRHARVVCENFGTPIEMLIDELRTEPKKMNHKEFKKFIKSCNLYKDKALTDSFIETFKASPFEVDCEGIIAAFDKEYPRVQATAAHSHGEAEGEDQEAMLSKEMKRERDKSIHLMQW